MICRACLLPLLKTGDTWAHIVASGVTPKHPPIPCEDGVVTIKKYVALTDDEIVWLKDFIQRERKK